MFASAEPGLDPGVTDGAVIGGAAPTTTVTWIDRHPLFSKPRDVYEGTASNNKLVKGAAATIVGVPVGVVGEVKQIIVGRSPAPASAGLEPAAFDPRLSRREEDSRPRGRKWGSASAGSAPSAWPWEEGN
jgi:hypothetical protein